MEEIIAIVNPRGKPVGRTTKSAAHHNGLLHLVVVVYLWNRAGKLYVQRREKSGQFDHSVAGHARLDETLTGAAAREVQEEFGVSKLGRLKRLGSIEDYFERNAEKVRHYYVVYETVLESKPHPNPQVISHLKTMSVDELLESMRANPAQFTQGFLRTIELYLKHKK